MAFKEEIKTYIYDYCQRDLPKDQWYNDEFNFIKDSSLRNRIIVEFKNARILYKIFEGLGVDGELLLAQVRLQILMYASIFEAVMHYVLFDEYYKEDVRVKNLLNQNICKPYSIPTSKVSKLEKELVHDGKHIIPYFKTNQKRDITKIRFDEKCKLAEDIGLIKNLIKNEHTIDFCAELIKIYEIRNAVHIHAEVKKDIEYHLEMSLLAYRRMRPFVDQIKNKLKEDRKLD